MGANFLKWKEFAPSGNIAVPFTFHPNFPWIDRVREYIESMNKDLGCIELMHVPYEELDISDYKFGLLFVHKSQTRRGGCWSALGRRPGFTGSRGSITEYGAPDSWQLVQLEETCGGKTYKLFFDKINYILFFFPLGDTKPVVQHQCLHALGLAHEHNRGDRDDFVTVHPERYQDGLRSSMTWKFRDVNWQDSGHPFELGSAMMIASHKAKKGRAPPLTLKDGSTWGMHSIMSTTDALQIHHRYCRFLPGFESKETVDCPVPDRVGIIRPVFKDRICDSIPDCEGGVDEDGTMGECAMPEEYVQLEYYFFS